MLRHLLAALAIACFSQCVAAEPPSLGLTARAEIVRVVDGDTVDVELTLPVRIRIIDCWAPEAHTPAGQAATEYLQSLAPVGSDVTLHVPTYGARGLRDVLTLNRVLGHLWDDDESVAEQMIEAGHASEEKQ